MNSEQLSQQIATMVEAEYSRRQDYEVLKFTPSVRAGVRYVGIILGNEEFLVEINVMKGGE